MKPSNVAIIGASAKPGKIGNILVRNISKSRAKVFPINPHESEIEGLRCYASISDITDQIDLAIIALPSEMTPEEVRKAADSGVKCTIISSAGFSEMGDAGRRVEENMVSYSRAKGMRILGPNTLGVFSPISKIDTMLISSERSPRPKRGKLGMISQSGSVQVSLLEKAEAIGIGVSYSIGLGNRSDISEIDLLEFLSHDIDTECITVYLESFYDGRRLLELAKKISPQKPIVAIKSGRTESGTRAASSHTGAIGKGSDALVDGAFKQAGIIRACDDEELLDFANVLMLMPASRGGRIAYVGSAGGIGVMAADSIESATGNPKLRMAILSDATKQKLRMSLESFAPINNPVDLTASSTPNQYDDAVRAVIEDPGVDLLILSMDMQPPIMSKEVFGFVPAWIRMGKPIIGTSTGGALAIKTINKLQELGIPSYASLSRCIKAVSTLCDRGAFLRKFS